MQACWQALALVHVKHCERPDMLANVPGLQQPHTLLLLAPVVGCCAAAMLTNTQAAKSRTRLLLHNMLKMVAFLRR